jgi:hypothetical protein
MPDLQRLMAEVAIRNKIRIEPDDPLFAVVTLNQLVLEETAQRLLERVEATITGFETSIHRVENRAGKMLAQRLKEAATEAQRVLQGDVSSACARAQESANRLHRARTRYRVVCWAAFGIAGALAVFWCGVWVGIAAFR